MQIQTIEGAIYIIEGEQERIFNALRASDKTSTDETLALIAFNVMHE